MEYTSREEFSAAFPGKPSFSQFTHSDVLIVPLKTVNYSVNKQSTN